MGLKEGLRNIIGIEESFLYEKMSTTTLPEGLRFLPEESILMAFQTVEEKKIRQIFFTSMCIICNVNVENAVNEYEVIGYHRIRYYKVNVATKEITLYFSGEFGFFETGVNEISAMFSEEDFYQVELLLREKVASRN